MVEWIKSFDVHNIIAGHLDRELEKLPIEEIYMIHDNDVKNAVLDRLKVIDGIDLPRVKA